MVLKSSGEILILTNNFLLRGLPLTFLSQFLVSIIGITTLSLFAHFLPKDEMGIFLIIRRTVAFLVPIYTLNLGLSLAKYGNLNFQKAFNYFLIFIALLCIIFCFSLIPIYYYKDFLTNYLFQSIKHIDSLIPLFMFLFVNLIHNLIYNLFRGIQNYKFMNLVNVVFGLSGICALLILLYPLKIETNKLKKISVVPQPYQKPHPPIWQVVDSPGSIKRAAELGINCIMWIPTVKSLKERFEIYKNAKSETEKRDVPLGEGICLVRDLFVADSMEEARELAGEQMVNYMRWVCHWRGLGSHMDPGEELPKTKNKLDLLSYDFLHKRNMLFGTPEYVIEKILELKSVLNLQNLQVWSNFPGVKHEHCMKSIKLFTEKVMPHFKNKLKTEVKKVS